MKKFILLLIICLSLADRIKLRQYAADINPMTEDAHYQFTTSSYETTFMVMFRGVCSDHPYEIFFEYLGTNETITFTETVAMFYKYPGMEGYATLTDYNFTIFKGEFSPCAVGVIFQEYFPEDADYESFVLSDNETSTYSDETVEQDKKYYRYYLPYKSIHKSKVTYIGINPLTEDNPIKGIYVGSTQYPDITDEKTYQYKLTEFKYNEWNYIKIEGNGDLPYYDGCLYYITVDINKGSEFAIQPSYERDAIELKETVINDIIVSPCSSSYGEIKLPKQSSRNTVITIDISFDIEPPYNDDTQAGLAVFISNETPYINPANAVWTKYKPLGQSIHFEITSEDGKYCDDCSYYLRIDGAKDLQYSLNTKINYTITHDIVPIRIKADTRMHGYFHGISLLEHRDVFLYIPSEEKNETTGKIDAIQITIQYDDFSEESADLLLSNHFGDTPLPVGCVEKTWNYENISSNSIFYISRDDEGFCSGIELLISLNLSKADGHEFNYLIFGHYEQGLRMIADGETVVNKLVPWTEGMFYAINMTAIDLDTDVIVHLQPHDNTQITLYSFRDGDMTAEWAWNCTINGINMIVLKRDDPNWKMNGIMFIRVDHTFDDDESTKQYSIDIHSVKPTSYELQIDGDSKTVYQNTKLNRTSYLYFTLNSKDITIVQSYNFNFTSLTDSGITEMYMSNTSYPKPDLGDYNYRIVMRTNPFTFDITRTQQGFCEKCVLYFAVKIPANEEAKFNFVDAEDLKYDQSIIGSINENSGAIAYKFGLTNLDQTNSHPEVVLHFGKSKESSNLIIGINPKTFVSNPKDAIWQAFTLDNLNATITINDQADEYCVGCTYYISIGYYSSQSTDDSVYEISLLCPNNDCNSCNDPHFTPESDCKECVSDYYGEDCSNLCNCNHGVCNDGRTGDGKCTCERGWDEPNCNKCKSQYFGVQCQACSIDCHGRDGAEGDGTCNCDKGFDTAVDCSSCISGIFGSNCNEECPGGASNACSGNGRCNDGINGNGRCLCLNGYYGLDCRATAANTTCHPYCVEGNGACDEDNGVCFCYDGNYGDTCSNKKTKSLSGGAIAGIVIACVVVIFVIPAVVYFVRSRPVERRRKSSFGHKDKNVLLENRASVVGAINV